PVVGNQRRCGCGAIGCLETLVSERGLLESFAGVQAATAQARRTQGGARASASQNEQKSAWDELVEHVRTAGIEPWLSDTLDASARIIAGALNVLGVHRVIVTGRLAEMPGCIDYLANRISKGAMWGRFGHVICQTAPHRRAAGLVAAGIDRLILPTGQG